MWFIFNFQLITKKILHLGCIHFIFTICKFEMTLPIEQTPYAIFCTILTAWSLISYKMLETTTLIKFSMYLLIPIMIMIEVIQGTRYYVITFFYPESSAPVTPGQTWLEKHSTALLLIFSFIYFISSVVSVKKIEVRNSIFIKITNYANRIQRRQQSKKSVFQICEEYIYRRFFMYFEYIMLILAILTSMVDINLLNFTLFVYCVVIMALQQVKARSGWVYYLFFIDICALLKVAICNMPRLGILNNIEITSVLGLYTLPSWKNGRPL